jgi:hypothetical protein
MRMEPKQRTFSIGYSIVALIALFLLQSVLFAPHTETLSYSEFKALVKKGKVSNLVLDKQTISGRVRETLGGKRVVLDALAKRRIEKEVVDRAALGQLIAEAESRDA